MHFKYCDRWFKSLKYEFVEPTNKDSERVGKLVVARKISGAHRGRAGDALEAYHDVDHPRLAGERRIRSSLCGA
ncbi:MAG: hypothetical protein ACUVQM_05780 [Candidatus Hadarchaeaceae archaeon]